MLKSQLNFMNANTDPFILQSQFFKEKFTGNDLISAFFAKLQQYQSRLATTTFPIPDIELMSHVLSYGVLPDKFEPTVKILRLQPNLTWTSITQTLINKEVQLSVQNLSSTTEMTTGMNSTAMMRKSKKNKNDHSKHKNNQKKWKLKHTKSSSDSQSDSDDDSHCK